MTNWKKQFQSLPELTFAKCTTSTYNQMFLIVIHNTACNIHWAINSITQYHSQLQRLPWSEHTGSGDEVCAANEIENMTKKYELSISPIYNY